MQNCEGWTIEQPKIYLPRFIQMRQTLDGSLTELIHSLNQEENYIGFFMYNYYPKCLNNI